MSLFVAGTDTGVGKTLVASLLLERYRRELPLVYWKPVATGARDERDRETVGELAPGIATAAEAYLFADPVSPHLAARREGTTIEVGRLAARWRELRQTFPTHGFVVEGAGGLLVPLDDSGTLLVDLVGGMRLPVLLVARSTLGTINHTLLSLEAMRTRDVEIAGVVMSGPPDAENRSAIERLGLVEVVGELPPLGVVTAATISVAAAEFDRAARLAPWLAPERPSATSFR